MILTSFDNKTKRNKFQIKLLSGFGFYGIPLLFALLQVCGLSHQPSVCTSVVNEQTDKSREKETQTEYSEWFHGVGVELV